MIIRRFTRKLFSTAGQESEIWPVILLLFAVVVPTICLLWFMNAAMVNERLAVRQRLEEAYRLNLTPLQARLETHWQDRIAQLSQLAQRSPPGLAFAKSLESGQVDALLIFDDHGMLLYPNAPAAPDTGNMDEEPRWQDAEQTEYLGKDLQEAAMKYGSLARSYTNSNHAARALQAQARCLAKAGYLESSIWVVTNRLESDRFRNAVDPQGRVIAANAELLAMELYTNHGSDGFKSISQSLKQRLLDYQNPILTAPQRKFLMKEMQRMAPGAFQFPTLSAEDLAAQLAESHPSWEANADFRPSPLPDVWQLASPDRRVIALFKTATIRSSAEALQAHDSSSTAPTPVAGGQSPPGTSVTLLPPGVENDNAFLSVPACRILPGWRLALSVKNPELLDLATEHRVGIYLWTAILVVAVMGGLTLLTIRLMYRQANLTRLKNDLTATVSHELKTPLAAMRVLVDTLIDSPDLDQPMTREYLGMIAKENERLSRLIQNFLTFNRLERKKYAMHVDHLPSATLARSAAEAVHERFENPGCKLAVEIEQGIPSIMGDREALTTALINLLDNAHKYTDEVKTVTLSAWSENGNVVFAVKDNGIGIQNRELKRIFDRFYQVDQRLSRRGDGCGLGLSIVKFIVDAHQGQVTVESRPGAGSTFYIVLPAARKMDNPA